MRGLVLANLFVLGIACGGQSHGADQPLIDPEDPDVSGARRGEPQEGAPVDVTPEGPKVRGGTIARADLDRVLDAGKGQFLATVEVKAHVVNGGFGGWEVVRTPYAEVDLRAGDVVLSVNGRALEHPLDFNLLWEDLRKADAIAVEVDRGGERFSLEFVISSAP
jgi:S1-C subfamily serine protease